MAASSDAKVAELKYNSAPRRRARMLSTIVENGYCLISELATAFEVSEMTVRRDIARLAASEQSLRIVPGGISAVPAWQSHGTDYQTRSMRSGAAKAAIARQAVTLLRPGQTVALNSGTTVLRLAQAIPDELALNVVTHSLAVANVLAAKDRVELNLLGGTYVRALEAFAGAATTRAIAELAIDLFFLAATSIDERGVLAGNEYDAATKRALVESAATIVLLADSSKFRQRSRFRVCSLARITTMLTDDGITDAHREMVAAAGVQVMPVAAAEGG